MIHINRTPSTSQLKQFAAIWLPLFGMMVGAILWWRLGLVQAAVWVWVATAILSAAALASRGVARTVFLGLSYLTFPIGLVVAWLGLALVFYLLVTPIGLVMRVVGRDPLRRQRPGPDVSMWHAHVDRTAEAHYFRQF